MQNPERADERAETSPSYAEGTPQMGAEREDERQAGNREEAEREREKALHEEAAERFEAVGDEGHAEEQRNRADEVEGDSA